MKRLLLLVSICLMFLGVHAQQSLVSSTTPTLNNKIDTVTNTATKTMTTAVPIANIRQTVTITGVVNKISGTGAGTITLYGSIDGVTYTAIAASQLQGAQTASYTITNVASQAYSFVILNNPFQYYQALFTGSGTEVIAVSAKILPR